LLSLVFLVFFADGATAFSLHSQPRRVSSLNRLGQSPEDWGGEYAVEAKAAAEMVCAAVRQCLKVQESLAVARGEDSLGTGVSASAAKEGASDVKDDGTPVTAADFGIQGYVSLKVAELFPDDRFMGEEDATDLRADPALLETARGIAADLAGDSNLAAEEFLNAVDRGVEKDRGKGERVWILDPIDGTKGLITGKQYIVGLALTINGKAVVAVMGNPGVSPEVMVAVKGCGLRYWPAAEGGEGCLDPPRRIPGNWHQVNYDLTKLVPAGSGAMGWGSGSAGGSAVRRAGLDYPPYLLSRPMDLGSPLPFGPLCAPSEVCCGAQVKYFAVARGDVAGFIQFQEKLKSWDHAPGVLCVQESGGVALDGQGNEVVFGGREFNVDGGIVCVAAEAGDRVRQLFQACVRRQEEE